MRQQIQHAQLETFLVQEQVLMLRVHVNQLFAKLLHLYQRGRRIVDKRTALARSIDFTAKDTLIFVFQFVFLKERLHTITGNLKTGFNHTFCSAPPDGFHIGTLPQQQTDSPQYDGLARTGLTGNHREAATEVYIKLLDKRIILYV